MRYAEQLHPRLHPMHRAGRAGLYQGPCPFCADGGDDRFHVWMEASGGRPAGRYWCRVCNRSGLLKNLDRDDAPTWQPEVRSVPARGSGRHVEPDPAHIPYYRQLYEAVALWSHAWLLDPCHPDPLAYLHRRGLNEDTISRSVLGVTLSDPESLVTSLREACPAAFPYAEEAGLVITDADGRQHTHWNLRGRIVFPYIADGQVVDLRTRTYQGQKGYRSLGPYEPRGAVAPFGWDSIAPGTKTVIITEAEFKALAALQAYHAGDLAYPTLGQPGLTVFRPEWARELVARGVEAIVLCYDSQPRRCKDGLSALTPEEQWSLRHGATCAAAGLQVRVARLPLASGEDKAELDTFLPRYGPAHFHQLIATAPLLIDYHRSIGCTLLERHNLPVPSSYPTRRERPTRLTMSETAALYTVRRHLAHVAARLHLRLLTRRRTVAMPRGGVRHYERLVLLRRGRVIPPSPEPPHREPETETVAPGDQPGRSQTTIDRARKKRSIARVIHHCAAAGRRRRARPRLAQPPPRSPP